MMGTWMGWTVIWRDLGSLEELGRRDVFSNFKRKNKMPRRRAAAAIANKACVKRSDLRPASIRSGQMMAPRPQAMFRRFRAAVRRTPEISATQRLVAGMATPKPKPYAAVANNAAS